MHALENKVAIVTGASSGIGRATAKLFAREGARLVVTARREAELSTLVDEIRDVGGTAVALAGDIRDEPLARELVAFAKRQYGGLDVAFNNAGTTGELVPVTEVTSTAWHDVIETNLTSAFLGAKYQLPALLERRGGSLIFTATFVGHTVGFPGMAAYAASPWSARQRDLAGRYRHADGCCCRQHAAAASGDRGLACTQTTRTARGDRAFGAALSVGRIQLHDGHGHVGRWWGVDLPFLKCSAHEH
jgi:NADP-dependent 3-hydroxy acid dehydrogenase YdfG